MFLIPGITKHYYTQDTQGFTSFFHHVKKKEVDFCFSSAHTQHTHTHYNLSTRLSIQTINTHTTSSFVYRCRKIKQKKRKQTLRVYSKTLTVEPAYAALLSARCVGVVCKGFTLPSSILPKKGGGEAWERRGDCDSTWWSTDLIS